MITHQEKVKCRKICAEINLVLRRRRCSPHFSSLGRWQLQKYRKKYCILFFFSCTFSWLLGQSGCRTSPPHMLRLNPFTAGGVLKQSAVQYVACAAAERRKTKIKTRNSSAGVTRHATQGSLAVKGLTRSKLFFFFSFFFDCFIT